MVKYFSTLSDIQTTLYEISIITTEINFMILYYFPIAQKTVNTVKILLEAHALRGPSPILDVKNVDFSSKYPQIWSL